MTKKVRFSIAAAGPAVAARSCQPVVGDPPCLLQKLRVRSLRTMRVQLFTLRALFVPLKH